MGKSPFYSWVTISMAISNSKLLVYQRVPHSIQCFIIHHKVPVYSGHHFLGRHLTVLNPFSNTDMGQYYVPQRLDSMDVHVQNQRSIHADHTVGNIPVYPQDIPIHVPIVLSCLPLLVSSQLSC